jgi:7-cyano-7-deazaguanine synthase
LAFLGPGALAPPHLFNAFRTAYDHRTRASEVIVSEDVSKVTGVLLSGGLDSSILLAHLSSLGGQIQPFYIRTGVSWERWEVAAAAAFLQAMRAPNVRPMIQLDLPVHDVYNGHWSMTGRHVPDARSNDEAVFLPGRNALLLVKAAVWCQLNGIDVLALAPLGTSPFADASPEFITRFEAAINCGAPRPLKIVLPFADQDKRQVMELGRLFPLRFTFSCIASQDGRHCGECNKCAERREAFHRSGILDETDYRL